MDILLCYANFNTILKQSQIYLFLVYITFLLEERLYATTGIISLSVIPLKIRLV